LRTEPSSACRSNIRGQLHFAHDAAGVALADRHFGDRGAGQWAEGRNGEEVAEMIGDDHGEADHVIDVGLHAERFGELRGVMGGPARIADALVPQPGIVHGDDARHDGGVVFVAGADDDHARAPAIVLVDDPRPDEGQALGVSRPGPLREIERNGHA